MEDSKEVQQDLGFNVLKIQKLMFNEKRLSKIFKAVNECIKELKDNDDDAGLDETHYIISGKFHLTLTNYFDEDEEEWFYDLDLFKGGDMCDCSRILVYSCEKYNGYEKEDSWLKYMENIITYIQKVNVLDAKKCSNCVKMIESKTHLYCNRCLSNCIEMGIEDLCAICQDENHLSGFYVYGEKCKHIFHKCCMDKCKEKCPLCNLKQNFYGV